MESYVGDEECMQVWSDRGPLLQGRLIVRRGRWIALFGLHKWDTSASIDSEDAVLFADLCVFCLVGEAEETEKKVLPWRKLRTRVWLQVRQRLWRGCKMYPELTERETTIQTMIGRVDATSQMYYVAWFNL
ncbi:unnamed protein product [Musa acuminata subsp. malaccensis]|uniref:(wild Malaysian banana) hypothetical protein n=1 Tax=Musa acuminata subsp. malaccensis TaxID=214687 RepID=A0A804JAI4_MUSAM|nr:unnamed protein product [Musa acuminata subsp. malaccensis]